MASFRRSGKGWRAEIHKLGVRESATFPTKREAQEWAARRELEIASHKSGQVLRRTLHDVIDRYINDITPGKGSERTERLRLQAVQRSFLGPMVMQDIKAPDLAAWRDDRLKSVKPSSVLREIGILRAVWRQAKKKEWGYVDHDPWSDVTKPKESPPRTATYDQEQVDRIVGAIGYEGGQPKSRRQEAAVAFLLSLETAMRAGEIIGLEWRRIDYEKRTAYLPSTKNDDARYVPLSTRAMELLKAMEGIDEQRVFSLTSQLLDTYFRAGRDLAGVTGLTFHDARATAITRLSKKLDILELARMVGHRDPRSLMVYYRASPTDIAKKLD